MGLHIANTVIKLMSKKGTSINQAKILILGITFKENCPDIRNSRVVDVIQELASFGTTIEVFDPHANASEVHHEYGFNLIGSPGKNYDAIILAVSHDEFRNLNWDKLKHEKTIVYDVKGFLDKSLITARL